jgi:glutamate-5-semialdehyde dehydrogenase
MTTLEVMGVNARKSSKMLARSPGELKNNALRNLADLLSKREQEILTANGIDISAGVEAGLSDALLDRLTLNPSRLSAIIGDLHRVADMHDPVGEVFDQAVLPNGLQVHKQRVPIGVLGVIWA